jgi:aminopeptidase N
VHAERVFASLRMTVGALLIATSPVAAQQTNAERILSGRDTPSHDYDLIHQRIEVKNFDWDATAFDGLVTTTVVSLRPGLDAIVLDMGHRLSVRAVTLAQSGRKPSAGPPARLSARFARPGDTLVIRLPRPAALGDTVQLTIDYRGKITQGRGLYFFKAEPGRAHRPQQIYSGGGTDGNPNWIPTYGAPHDKETWELVATAPPGFTVVSNGRQISDVGAKGKPHTVTWRQERPASTYLISLVIAPLVKVADKWRDTPLAYYVYPEDAPLARRLFGMTPDVMETYTRLTGVKYPWPQYAQTTVTDFIGGMENVGATTLVDWLPDGRAYQDRPWYRQSLIPHELAHQWFGNLVTTENWVNYWLNEGMAEFMGGQYWGSKQGSLAEEDYYLDEYRQFLTIDARRRSPLAAFNSNNVYSKGALVLEMLKQQLGPERFWAAIHRYLTGHAYGNALTEDLRRAVLEATGQNLEWFWRQWMYQAGYPEFVVTSAYDSADGSVALTVRQVQMDTLRADSTGFRVSTPLAFTGPVNLWIASAKGDVRRRLQLERREQVFRISGVRAQPTMVVFDEGNALLKTLTFEQPTSMLATQLARDPNLWNLSWVIQQLSRRVNDSLAQVALSRAVRTGEYYRIRAEAALGLSQFPAASALPPLEAAMRDTSATVRERAVEALGSVGGDKALALLIAAWKRDSSYEVRASALAAASALDSAGSRELVRTGLSTPSYRDVIQNAAIDAAVVAPDSAIVDGLEKILGDQRGAALALATLARRGDNRALTALVRHKDDTRAWVRRWVLDAIDQQVEKTP